MAYFINDNCIGCQACLSLCPCSAITGNKKEPHVIAPDICIECGACGRICPAKAVEDSFGAILKQVKKKLWETPRIDLDTCMSCGICLDSCPAGALTQALLREKNPHPFPVLEQEKCMGCGFCEQDCPVSAITMESGALPDPPKSEPGREETAPEAS